MLVMNCWEFFYTNIDVVVTLEFPWYSEALDPGSTQIGRLLSFRRIPTTQKAGGW